MVEVHRGADEVDVLDTLLVTEYEVVDVLLVVVEVDETGHVVVVLEVVEVEDEL